VVLLGRDNRTCLLRWPPNAMGYLAYSLDSTRSDCEEIVRNMLGPGRPLDELLQSEPISTQVDIIRRIKFRVDFIHLIRRLTHRILEGGFKMFIRRGLWMMFFLVLLSVMQVSAEMGEGRVINLELNDGEGVYGMIKKLTLETAEILTDSGLRTIKRADVKRVIFVKDAFDQALQENVKFSIPSSPRAVGPAAFHRLNIFSMGGGQGYGGDLVAYEYINRARWGFKFSFLNGYFRSEIKREYQTGSYYYAYGDVGSATVAYAPFWIRRYFAESKKAVWPFIGAGIAYTYSEKRTRLFPDDFVAERGINPAGEIGIDFGGRTVRGVLSFRYLHAPFPIMVANVGLSIGWSVR